MDMSGPAPVVSVVIPTINRPDLVLRAVTSALGQTLRQIEVIVVVDGPDEASAAALRHIVDPRLRIRSLATNRGVGGARNAGVDEARGPWVAFLDDDDEWLPQKLERQLDAAERSTDRHPIIASCFIARTEQGDVLLPRRFPREGEDVSDYLFCQTRLLGGEGIVLPSTIFTTVDLVRRTRFRYVDKPQEGSDWLLRAVRGDGATVKFVPTREPLAVWYGEATRHRISNGIDWRSAVGWAVAHPDLLTPRSCAAFILIRAGLEARRAGAWSAVWSLPKAAFRHGRPTIITLLAYALIWLVPGRIRFTIAALVTRWFPFSGKESQTPCCQQPRP